MPLDKGKLQKLYSTLQQGGYSQSYDEFEKGFTGNDNYPNRKKVYDLLTEHGADIGNSYEDFMKKMYTPAASSPSSSQQRTQAPAPKPQPKPAPKPKPRPQPKPKGGGMTAAERAQFIRNAQGIVHHSAAGLQRVKNQMDYANGNRGLKVNPVHLGQNAKVVRRHANGTVAKPRPVFDVTPEQQPGDTYLTESGNEFASRAEADTEQNAVDQYRYDQSETGQLNNAYAEAERLDKLLEQRGKELDAENQDKWWRDLPRGGGGAVSTMNANDNNGRMTDTEYLNLLAARKKVDEQIRDLKAARDEKTGTFLGGLWRGFRDYAFDPSNWDNGYRDLLTTSAMLRAKTGAAQTPREKASERMMMEDTYKAGEAAQKAEKVLGNGYRFMRIGAQSLPFALQFMAGNATGMISGLTRAGEGMGVKLARKIAIKQGANNMLRNIGRSVLKNTGVMLGDLGAATALTTTIQAGQTGADIGQRYVGDVAYDPKTDDYKLEGGKSLGRSIYEGEANSIIENYTEMLGEHMHLGKFASSALTKVGLGRVSNWFTKVGKTDFMQGVNKYMKMAGFNGYPQEVMEEEVGIPLHAIFDGGNKMSDLLDGRQQLDIVGGMLFSMAGMGGASMAMQGGHKAAMAVQYHQDQHKLDNADKVASFRLTADKWAPIKDEIDGTTNEDFGKTMKDVLSNDELSDQEKQAVWDYAQRLIIMRGHNMGQEAATRNGMTDKETNAANESYTQGYNTTDPAAMNDAKNRLAAAQQKLDEYMESGGKETWKDYPDMLKDVHGHTDAQGILDAKWNDGSPMWTEDDDVYKMAQDVVNAQQEYEGMMQRVRDDIDDEVQQTGAIYDSRTNDNGVIQSATLKAQNPDGTGKKVYITSGNVVMTDDGKSVDREKSDMSIVVVDDEGKVQMISPDEIFSLDAPLDGEQAKQQAIDAIKKSKAQEAADKINGKVDYTAGNTYTLTDSKGQQIEATLVADQQTGAVENQDGSVNVSMGGKVVPMAKETFQQMVDNTNMQRTAQGDEEAAAAQQPTEGADNAAAQQQPTEQADENGNVDASEEGSAVPSYPGSVVAPSEPHQWQMDDTFVIDNGGVPVRGQVTGIDADGVEIYTESPINGKKMQVISPEELQSMTTEINGETVQGQEDAAAAMQQPTQPVDGEQTGDNGSNGVNGEQPQGQAEPLSSQAEPQQTEGQQPQRAIDRIPSQQVDDGKGNVRTVHNWEQAEPGDTYDALTEIYHGNADRVKKGVQNRIGAIDKQIKATQKQMDAIDNSDDFDAVAAQGEKYDQLQQQKAALEQQKKYWQGVQNVPVSRRAEQDKRTEEEKAAAKAARQQAEQEAIEKARQERERVNGVPDVINDTPSDARQRGFRNVNGMVVNRQGNTEGVTGRESSVKFSSKDTAKGKVKVIEADQLQPSHVNGQRNPQFFIDEAQPKDRTDTVSSMAAAKIASNLNPEEITGDGSAYQFSAPTVNSRGEVIQGNNRSDALKLMYSTPAFKPAQDAYKQYIIDHASDFGFTPEDVAKIQQMQHPVMVNELGVDDDEAIRLGQMKASDNESGGIERIDPVTTSQKLGAKVGSYANILLSSPDEDASLSDVLMQNGAKTVHWLSSNGIISNTAAQSAFDRKGNLTPEARMDLLNILKQSLFQGGVSDLPAMFDKMPAKAQKAILNTFMRDFDSAESERILPDIQKAIEAWYDCAMSNEAFAKAPNYKGAKNAMHDWERQTNMLDDNMPSDKFSNFARELACRLQGCSMRETQQSLNDFFDLVQGKSQGDLFGGTTMGEQADRQESIRRIFNIEYKPISNNNGKTRSNAVADNSSQSGEGRQGSPTDGKGRERAESGSGSADGAGGTESHDEEGVDKGAAAMQQPTQPSGDSKHSIGATSSSEKKETERQGVNTEPTEKQKEAGNYKKGHIKVDGYDISIENPKGSVREKKDANGKVLWRTPMHYDYGYILGTKGTDGDHIDVYLSDNPTSGNVYVVDQIDQKTGKFDEHKVMYGFPSKEAAVEAYKGQYAKGWKVGTVTEVSREDFKKWVESSKRKTKPFSEYKSVKDQAAAQQRPTELSTPTGTNGGDGSHGENGADGKKLESVKDVLDEAETRQDIAKYATMKADELRKREPDELRTLERKELAQADTNEQLAKIAQGKKREKLLKDAQAHRANGKLAGRIRQEVEAERGQLMEHRSNDRNVQLTKREKALRDELVDIARQAGIETITDVKEGQRVLDMANGVLLNKNKKRALETALLWDKSHFKGTVVSSADGAKILNKIDTLAKEYENEERNTRNFISDAGKALNAKRKEGSTSQYATFETKNGNIVTIRITDHNAKVENFDHNNQENAISIVISRRGNNGLTKNGESHVIEFYYSDKELNKLGKDGFVQILKGIKQALYSGEFKDTTGLAERQEVNAGDFARLQKVYHGSGNDFDMFQTMRHIGEGEGNQAFGVGTYVADQMDLAKKYAYVGFERQRHRVTEGTLDGKPINWNHPDTPGYVFVAFDKVSKYGKEEALKSLKQNIVDYESVSKLNPDNKSWQEHLEESKKAYDLVSGGRMTIKLPDGNHAPILYTVNIPDDNGHNYLDWDKAIDEDASREIVDSLYSKLLKSDEAQYLYRTEKNKEKLHANLEKGIYNKHKFGDIYQFISSELRDGKSASEFLHELGYTGIKVHASYYSADPEYNQNWNYVIFNDKDLKITDKVRFFRTANGEAYGFTVGGKIYIDPRIATSETPIHEYAHLWAEALRKANPKEWQNVVELMKGCKAVWEQVKKEYPELETDDEIAEEVLAHYSGKRGAERLRAEAAKAADEAKGDSEKAKVKSAFSRLKDAIKKTWKHIAEDILHIHFTNADEVADKVMYDLLNRVNPKVHSQIVEERAEIERKAKKDGTWMKAPNGQESNLSADQWVTVRTKQFKDWFGDWEEAPEESSQAVDENGEPKVFYHNTDNDFTVFDANRNGTHTDAGWLGDGFYFYGDENEGDGYGHKKMEVFLNVRNMYYATSTENEELADANDREKSIAFRNEIEDEGYDGVYYNGDLRKEAVVFYPEQIKSATDNVGTYDAATPDIRYEKRTDRGYSTDSVKAANQRFNEELDAYSNQQMTKNDMLHLGMPSGVLAHFLPNLPIVMRQRILTKANVKKHNVDPLALRDMPKMMSHPIFIFQRADNATGILTEMKDRDGKNVCVAIDLDREIQDGGETLNVNDIRSIHGRELSDIVYPILKNGTLKWVDKKKGLAYLSSASHYVQQEIDKQNLSSAAKIVNGFENPVIKDENLSHEGKDGSIKDAPTTAAEAEEADVLYRIADDDEAARLDSEPTVKVYRAMQEHDGKLYPPMSGRVKTQVETKKGTMRTKWVWRSPIEIGKWEQSEEHPEMANEDGTFTLDKGNGSTIDAAYNPYIHTSRTPINDQFSSAWNRPELVTVEVEVPVSELTSGYHAEKAKDATGEVEWKSGPVGREMAAQGNPRMVILSRWDKPVRIVPVDEVADEYAVRLAGTGIKVPFNTVPPALRDALVARGVEISEPEKGNAGQASRPSYEEWMKGNTRQREGNGAYTDEELSLINDPVAKWLGKSNRTKAQQKAFANRERRSMESTVKELADRLHLDNVNIVMDASTLEGRKARAKGFYDRNTNEITIVIPNHRDVEDVMQTLLHEGVAHYGLRKMFGSHFDTFLDNVYAAADNDVRRRITDLALKKYGGDFRVATEEYLASLAEQTDFEHIAETFWQKIKDFFLDMLHAIGFADFADKYDFTLSDNELRYILWRSYENLKEPGRYRSILGEAEDVAKQAELKVGNYSEDSEDRQDSPSEAADSREDAIKRLTPRLVNTFKSWAKARNAFDEAFKKDPEGRWTFELGDELNKWNDLMDAAKDAAFDYGIDLGELLRDNGISGDDLEKYDDMFGGRAAGEPQAWGKRDMLSRAEQVSHGIDPDLLFRDTIEDDDNTARETYNRMADEAKSRIREAWQDSMINVRNLQQAVLEQRGEKLEDYEDAYNAENRSHGKSRAEREYFTDNLYNPLLKAVDDVAKAAKVSVGDVTEYMMAKHGLERNIVFARRDADAAYKKAYDEAKGKYDALMNASRAESDPKKADALEKAANKVKFPDYDDIFNYLRMRDYAGLTALTGQSDVLDAEAEAQRIVNDMESRVASIYGGAQDNPVSKLWEATNAATKWTLKKGYESGIISKDNYNYVSGMFNYYVPLRGWQEDTAGDLFDYVGSGDKGTAFSPTLHKAKGRRSEADNPIAYIGNMAVSAIVQGNKNKVKQTFLGFVENHPTNLVTVSEMWYRNFGTDTDPDWREDVPNIPEDATADEVADIVKQHEDMMEQLEDLGKATKKRGRLHLGVPVKKGQALEHHVEVMVNGKKYVLYINGNPRAAQALNGTRQRRASERSFESSKIAQMGRLLAERYTSLSPSFTVSNALRDLTMAAITTLIKESPAYALRFRLNVLKLGGPARMFTLMKWYKKAAAQQQPTGQMSETQKYFYEFMTEGAETGFTSLKEIDEYKKDMDKMYRNMNQKLLNPKRLFRGLSQGLEYANRCIEDMTRFAIYMASRQSGRNVKRSVNDAKNVTLNFNRKGSGELGNATYRNLQIFVNPAIQSLQNVGKMAKDHPARFTLLTGSIALIGAAQVFATQLLWSVFGGGDGDDDDWNAVDEYWKLPSWQRRNNLVVWIPGTKKFAMIPLAQEFRVFHGFGETMTTVMEGKSGENPALEVLTQASDLLPLDFAGNNGNPLVNLAPTVTQPLLQVGFNTDFTGRPLYKDNDFNKYEPSFQKAYVGTPSWLIKSSEFINDITGGDDHMQGWWERTKVGKELNNPAVVDHILKGYYGGMYSFLAQLGGTMYTLGTGNMPDAQEVPVVNRVITAPRETEQGGKQKLPDWYYDLSEENARQQNEFSGYKKDYMKGDAAGQRKFNELINSKDFQKWQEVNTYIGAVQQIRTAMNYTKDPKEKAELEESLAEVLGELKKMKDE